MKQKNKCRDGIYFRPCRGGFHIRPEKGITLIALIITIIVMLILVAVTVTVTLNGGLFNYARKAAKGTNEAMENEKLLSQGIINGQTIDDIVGTPVSDDWSTPATELPVDENGNYHIKSCAELAKFAEMVNTGTTFEGETVYLDKNLDLKGNENKQWTPIDSFDGTLDGQNHYISGVYIEIEDGFGTNQGLFGYVKGNLKNLGVDGYISAGNCNVGGIVANGRGVIENCYNKATIKSTESGDDMGVGGIAGIFGGTIKNCYNNGEISADFMFTGGIVGYGFNSVIENCYNAGTIKTSAGGGGIIDYCENELEIKNCYNIGTLDGSFPLGEIFGSQYDDQIITNCYFLSGTGNNAVGENPDNITVDATAKTPDEMKADAFVTLLNNGGTAWKKDTKNINKGYPILSWQ